MRTAWRGGWGRVLRAPGGRRTAAGVAAAGALMLVGVWLLGPQAPPLYDGVCLPGQYMYLSPPPGSPGSPSAVNKTIDVGGGQPGVQLITKEAVPQAQLLIGEGSLRIPQGTSTIRLAIEPVPPATVAPPDGHIDGNVYRFSATTSSGAPVEVAAGSNINVLLLSPTSALNGKIEEFRNGSWKAWPTSPSGCAGTLAALPDSFGDFAIVVPGKGGGGNATEGGASGGGVAPVVLVVGAVVVLFAVIVGLVRVARARGRP